MEINDNINKEEVENEKIKKENKTIIAIDDL